MDNNKNQAVPPLIDQTKASENNERYFNLLMDSIPNRVEFEPFFSNDQVRYYVSINAGPKDVFVSDTTMEQFRAIDDKACILPAALEQAISTKLQAQKL